MPSLLRWSAILSLVVLAPTVASSQEAPRESPVLCLEASGHTAMCNWLDFTPDGARLVSLGDDKVIRIWDVRDPTAPTLDRSLRFSIGPGHEGKLFAGAISPDGRWLAVGGYTEQTGVPNGIRVLDLTTGAVVTVLRGHSNVINGLAFSADGAWLASASTDKTVRVWEVGAFSRESAQDIASVELEGHTDEVRKVAFLAIANDLQQTAKSGRLRLISVSDDKTGRIWTLRDDGRWEHLVVLNGHTGHIRGVACSGDGRWIATTATDRTVRLWRPDGSFVQVLGTKSERVGVSPKIAFAPNSRALVAADDKDGGGAVVWSVPEGRELSRYDGHDNTVMSVAFRPWSQAPRATDSSATENESTDDVSDRSDRVIASTGGAANDICLWDARTGRELSRIVGRGSSVPSVAFSPDGARLGYGHVSQGVELSATDPLASSFDLARMEPGPKIEAEAGWLRGRLTADGLSAVRPSDAINSLVIRRGSKELTRIERQVNYDRIRCFAFLPGRRQIVIGSDFNLTWHEAATGKLLRTFMGHTGTIWAVAASPDGRFLASTSSDQTIRLWSLERKETDDANDAAPLLTLFITKDGQEWVVWTEEGYYKSSANGDQLIGWHLNLGPDQPATFIQAWQLRNQFHWPELLALVPGAGGVKRAIELYNSDPRHQRRETVDLNTNAQRLLPPEVRIAQPAPQTAVAARSTRLQARISLPETVPQQLPVFARVMVNDRPIPGWDQRKLVKNKAGAWTPAEADTPPGARNVVIADAPPAQPARPGDASLSVDVDVSLVPGENVLSVVAWTELSTSQPAKVRVTSTAPPGSTHDKPDLYVLAIGVSDYEDDGVRDLKFADVDAAGLAQAFESQAGQLYGKVSVYRVQADDPKSLLTNERATRRNVLKGIKWLRDSVTQVDVAVVCVSGHGAKDNFGSYYFLPYETDPNDLEATAVRWSELQDTLSRLPCPVLLVMDTCHAAGVTGRDRSLQERSDETQAWSNFIGEVTKIKNGLYVFSAAMPQQRALEDERWGHGALTLSLLEGLGGRRLFAGTAETPLPADTNGNGLVELPELRTYVVRRVKELTKGYQHAEAQPKELPALPLAKSQ